VDARRVGLAVLGLLAIGCVVAGAAPNDGAEAFYYHARIQGSINPVTADYLDRAVGRAEADGAAALILQLNTPGGLMDSMRSMTGRILNAGVPVIVWVGPPGARAASAGVFITYSAHVAAMAESTNMGAAHPVSGGGGSMDETMEDKVVNDAVAQLEGLARKRGRNAALADSFVRRSLSLTAREAFERGAVDLLANSRAELLEAMEGRTVSLTEDQTRTLPGPAPVRALEPTWKENFLDTLVNPNLVYLLMMLGIYGLIYEFANPGVGLGGAVGGVCLLLALYGMSVLPISYAGLGLIVLGIALMVLDLFVPSFMVLTLGGLASFVLGSVMLFETASFRVSAWLVAGVATATAGFILGVGYLILSDFRRASVTGQGAMIGRSGRVRRSLDPEGMIYVWGEYWTARSRDGATIPEGERVRVVGQEERTMIVEPAGAAPEDAS